jgi:CRP-like cAMP-binding protein
MMDTSVRFIGPLEAALHLKSLEALRELPRDELAVLAQQSRERYFAKGTALFRSGQPVGGFHLIVEGKVRTTGSEHGDNALGPGEVLGLLTLLSRSELGLDAVAEADTTTLEIDGDDLADVFEDHFDILHNQLKSLSRRMLAERGLMPDGTYLAPAEGLAPPPERDLDLIQRLDFMRRDLSRENIDGLIQVARQAREVRYAAGARLWSRGDSSGFICILVRGTVRCALDGEGRHFRCGPGYPLGNLESLAGEPRWYDAVSETPLVTLRSETDVMIDIFEDHFEMAIGYVEGLAAGIIQAREQRRGLAVPAPEDAETPVDA